MTLTTNWNQSLAPTKKIGYAECSKFIYLLLNNVVQIAKTLSTQDPSNALYKIMADHTYISRDKGENLKAMFDQKDAHVFISFSENFTSQQTAESENCKDCVIHRSYQLYYTVLPGKKTISNQNDSISYHADILLMRAVKFFEDQLFCTRKCITIKVEEDCYIEYSPRGHNKDSPFFTTENISQSNRNYLTATQLGHFNFREGNAFDK